MLNLIFKIRTLSELVSPGDELVQRRFVHDFSGRIANLLHHKSNDAGAFIRTIIAAGVAISPDAGDRSERAVDKAHDFTKRDGIRRPIQQITAFFALAALQNSTIAEFKQNRLQEFSGDFQLLRDIAYLDGALASILR